MEQVQPSVDQMNEVIALFIGYEKYEDKQGIWFKMNGLIKCLHPKLQELNFHRSWDLLMPILAKIKYIANAIDMPREFISRWKPIENELRNINIINTHYCAYKFIQWYNQQKQSI